MPGKGKRIFPDAKTPSDQTIRAKVLVKVKTGAPAGWKVRPKAFDVDDPTTADPDHIIDPNDEDGEKGDDNRKRFVPFRPAVFTYSSTETVDCTIDAQGVAKVNGQLPELIIPNQPGDNIRVAAIFLKPNGDPMDGQNINILQAGDKTQPSYVPSGDAPPSGFSGGISPMLTTWRTLHIEVDQMQMWVGNKPSPDRTTAQGSWEPDGTLFTAINLSAELPEGNNFYAGGYIKSGSVVLAIHASTTTTITVANSSLTPQQKAAFENTAFEVFDDDDIRLSGPPLPRSNIINDEVKKKYIPAYIEIEEIGPDINLHSEVPFEINSDTLSPTTTIDDALDLEEADRSDYWYHYLVVAYQSSTIVTAEYPFYIINADGDPDSEPGLEGVTIGDSPLYNDYTVLFVEAIRDKIAIGTLLEDFAIAFQAQIDAIVAHEIAHSPGNQSSAADHDELGLMKDGPEAEDGKFTPLSIRRFRSSFEWH